MNIQYHEVKKLPVVVIDDFYDEIAQEKIMQELLFLNNDDRKLADAEMTSAATEQHTRKILRQGKSVFLNNVFVNNEYSNILTESSMKLFNQNFINILTKKHKFFSYFFVINVYSTLVGYYEQSDYYKSHNDNAIMTAIVWFYKNPKSFSGGNLIIEKELEINCEKNRMIIFPSILEHEVTEINMKTSSRDNYGRFSTTHFFSRAYDEH